MKILIFLLTVLLFFEDNLAYVNNDFKNLYTLVNGMLISPSASARTIGKNILRTGISGYYYRFNKLQNGELYFPIRYFRNTNQDALINFIVEYGIFKNSEISLLIPYAPDWQPNKGGNKQGIADIAILFKQYLLTSHNIDMGLSACYKLSTSTFADDPRWYGTNYSNIILKFIFSTQYKKAKPFINIGYKNVLGSGKIKSYEHNIHFTYSNTYIGAIGLDYQLLKTLEISLESNFESHNKKGIAGYYLDICGGINLNLNKNIISFGKIGKNISDFAPSIYVSAGISVVTKL